MHELTKLIKNDMKPALGVTEPGAIAFAVSAAKSYLKGELKKITLELNSGMYKNAYTCGIPGSSHVGNLYAAALGAVAGRPEQGLESLSAVTEADNRAAEQLVEAGMVEARMTEVTSRIFIRACVETEDGVDAEELLFIKEAFSMNYALFEEGLKSPRTTYARYLLKKNGGEIISADEQRTASLLCNAAIEARVIGLDRPAMSITGSGAQLSGVYVY